MAKKIIEIIVCMLLIIATVLPVTSSLEQFTTSLENKPIGLLVQPPEAWNTTFGGITADNSYYVQQTSDGGYIVVGSTYSSGIPDVYLIKTDANGIKQWDKTLYTGGIGYCVQQTTDGGYIIAGSTFGISDVLLLKTDANGVEQWNTTFGAIKYDAGYSVQQTTDGGYIIAGAYTYVSPPGTYDAWLIKTDASGVQQWDKKFGGGFSDYGYSVQQTSDGGYILTGSTNPTNTNEEVYLIKTDSSGNTAWTKTFGGANEDKGWSVRQTTDGGYIIAGWTNSLGAGNYDVYLIKTDSSGNAAWTKTFGGANDDASRSVWQTTDGGYIIAGSTNSFGAGLNDIYLIKTDSSGDKQWNKTYGGSQSDHGYCVQQTSDSGYIVAGDTTSYGAGNSDIWLIKLGISFNFKLTFLFGKISNLQTVGNYTQFNAVNLLCIQFSPFKIVKYNSGETVTFSTQILGILSSNFIIGFYNADI
jgi:hypothetical protein